MPAFPRLSRADIERVRAEHRLVYVLARLGCLPPNGWDGTADFMICCPCPDHGDTTPSCIVHPQTDRFNCFGCQACGDVLELVRRVEGVTSLSQAAAVLDSGRPLRPTAPAEGASAPRPARVVDAADRPQLDRTSAERVLDVNRVAWRYLTSPKLADRARAYLAARGIHGAALEKETGRPLAAHSPYEPDGLTTHLRRAGFSDDEIVDAGWASRRGGGIQDRFRRRVLVPVRDEAGQVIGVYGRDVTGNARQKYLNTAETAVFHKRDAIYRPSPAAPGPRAVVIACEGSMDALAIAAHAANSGLSSRFAPVSPSGTALTDDHARRVLALTDRPILVCADGDDAGVTASATWAQRFMTRGRETMITVLPDGHDPASWLGQHGAAGLNAFIWAGAADDGSDVRPQPAGGLLARQAMTAELAAPGADPLAVLPGVLTSLAAQARLVPGEAAAARFADAAGATLASFGVGTDSGLSRVLRRGIANPSAAAAATPAAAAVACQVGGP